MPRIEIADWARDDGHRAATGEANGESFYRLLAQAGGLTQFGAHIECLPPGSRSSAVHRHEGESEMIYVLSGLATLIEDEAISELTAGDAPA